MERYMLFCLAMSFITFIIFGVDKLCSKSSGFRIPEITLLTLSAIGGALGAFAGRSLFRHKTNMSTKAHFFAVIYVSLFVQLGFAILLLWRFG